MKNTYDVSLYEFLIFVFIMFVSPCLAVFTGLGLMPSYIILLIAPMISFFKKKNWSILYEGILQKVTITILIYIAISCLWAIEPANSFILWLKITFIAFSAFMLFDFVKDFNELQKDKLVKIFYCGIVIALICIGIEVSTDGFLTKLAHLNNPEYVYHLTDLNRGSSFLSIAFWSCLAMLLVRGKILYAILLGLPVLLAIHRLESTSAMLGLVLGFIIAGVVYKFGRIVIKIMMIGVVFGVIAIPAITTVTTAEQLNNILPVIPGAASTYRLYIWDFAGNKALEKPIFGWGFDASRKVPVLSSDLFLGGKTPMPLHPHNNTMQIWLELGIVGLLLFIAFLTSILYNIGNCTSRLYMSCGAGLFSTYFIIGQVGYGIWQNWWIAGGLLATGFLLIKPKTL